MKHSYEIIRALSRKTSDKKKREELDKVLNSFPEKPKEAKQGIIDYFDILIWQTKSICNKKELLRLKRETKNTKLKLSEDIINLFDEKKKELVRSIGERWRELKCKS